MWAVTVVVVDVLAQNGFEVPSSEDEHPVQAFSPEGADEALGVRVRLGRSHRSHDDSEPFGGEDLVEWTAELRVAIADQESSTRELFPGSKEQVAGLLGHPRSRRIGRHACEVHAPGVELDEEQDVETTEQDRVDREEVRGQEAWA